MKTTTTSDFISARELAGHLGGIDLKTLDRWILANTVPPPHCRPGERSRLWLRRHYDEFRDTGRWPKEAWPKGEY